MQTLHLTNGDSAAHGIVQSGLGGLVLPWRDVLHDGPVPRDTDGDESRAAFVDVRARFLASGHGLTVDRVRASLEERDATLDGIGAGDELVLWFEPDLYDQLQLMQVLARLAVRAPATRPHIRIVPADCFLGPMDPKDLPALHDQRRALTESDLVAGAAAWRAFTAPEPDDLVACALTLDAHNGARTYADDAAVRLPHLAAAMRRFLEEYPDQSGGLSRTERQICEALTVGSRTMSETFRAQQRAESWYWLGDTSFAWYVRRLSDCPSPLILYRNGASVTAMPPASDARSYWEQSIELTPFGLAVLRGQEDHVRANGIDRWYGGTHVTSARYWRWDAHQHCLVAGDA